MKVSTIIFLTAVCFVLSNAEKPGDCPVHEFTTLECADLCSDDESCPGNQKCCNVNGCKYICEEPVNLIKKCPVVDDLVSICVIQEDHCYSDDDCSNSEKCCSNGCGKKCTSV